MIYLIPDKLFDETPCKKYVNLFKVNAPNFWYLHGKLESTFHYDKALMFVDLETKQSLCIEVNGMLYINDGIYDVTIEGYDKPCKAYMWYNGESQLPLLCGLVVDPDDTEWAKDAESKYNSKPLVV